MWQAIISSGLGAIIVERVFDWFQRKRAAVTADILKIARAAFNQALTMTVDARDKLLAWNQFDALVRTGLAAAGLKVSDKTEALIAQTFEQLWNVWARDAIADELQDLISSSSAAKALGAIIKRADPDHP